MILLCVAVNQADSIVDGSVDSLHVVNLLGYSALTET